MEERVTSCFGKGEVEFVVDSAAERGARGGEEGTLAMLLLLLLLLMVFSSSCSLGSCLLLLKYPFVETHTFVFF